MIEDMPIPTENGAHFNEWLVPARNNIQRELLRLQKLIGHPSARPEDIPQLSHRDDQPYIDNMMVGVGFSLWRAVFQAGLGTDRHQHAERARVFLNEIIKNNAAIYSTELNAWSLGYYLGNAQFRLMELNKTIRHVAELNALIDGFRPYNSQVPNGPEQWMRCFEAFRLILDLMEPQQS